MPKQPKNDKQEENNILILSSNSEDDNSRQQNNSSCIEEDLEQEGIFLIDDVITNDSVRTTLLNLIQKNNIGWNREIQIFINSPGGITADGWGLIDMMQIVSFPVRTIAIGRVNSMAALLVSAGDKGRRYILENTEVMIHQHSSYMEGQYNQLSANQNGQDQEYRRHINFWIKHSKFKTEKQIRENILKDTDNYLTPQDMKRFGMIDHIIRSKKK